jgi:hypothetical protein
MVADVLGIEGYDQIEPVHPQGGPDGKRDIRCVQGGIRFVCACYFPPSAASVDFKDLRSKFKNDLAGVTKDGASGFVFATNVHLTEGERQQLETDGARSCAVVVLYHLEKLRAVLDRPVGCGIRLRYLDIAMTKEEQVAFFAQSTDVTAAKLERMMRQLQKVIDALPATHDEAKGTGA